MIKFKGDGVEMCAIINIERNTMVCTEPRSKLNDRNHVLHGNKPNQTKESTPNNGMKFPLPMKREQRLKNSNENQRTDTAPLYLC